MVKHFRVVKTPKPPETGTTQYYCTYLYEPAPAVSCKRSAVSVSVDKESLHGLPLYRFMCPAHEHYGQTNAIWDYPYGQAQHDRAQRVPPSGHGAA